MSPRTNKKAAPKTTAKKTAKPVAVEPDFLEMGLDDLASQFEIAPKQSGDRLGFNLSERVDELEAHTENCLKVLELLRKAQEEENPERRKMLAVLALSHFRAMRSKDHLDSWNKMRNGYTALTHLLPVELVTRAFDAIGIPVPKSRNEYRSDEGDTESES